MLDVKRYRALVLFRSFGRLGVRVPSRGLGAGGESGSTYEELVRSLYGRQRRQRR